MMMEVMKDTEYIATMRSIMIEKKEEAIRKAAGMEIITLSPEEAQKFLTICYDKTWEFVTGMAPEYGPKLKELSSPAALPKGAFPWQ